MTKPKYLKVRRNLMSLRIACKNKRDIPISRTSIIYTYPVYDMKDVGDYFDVPLHRFAYQRVNYWNKSLAPKAFVARSVHGKLKNGSNGVTKFYRVVRVR